MNDFPLAMNVLCYGHDSLLLLTRQWLLERAGYAVATVTSDREFREKLCVSVPEVIVLCQTLSPDECCRASLFVEEQRPSSKCLVLFGRLRKCVPQQEYVLLDAALGPATFVQTIKRMTASSSSSRAAA